MNPIDLWDRVVTCYPHRIAAVGDDESCTFEQLDVLSDRIVTQLLAAGCRPGDRVGTVLPDGPLTLAAYLAVWKVGASVVPVNSSTPASARDDHLSRTGTQIVIECDRAGDLPGRKVVHVDRNADPTRARSPRPRDSLAACFLTSATTGRAKLVGITDDHLCTALLAQLTSLPSDPAPVLVCCNPLAHGSMYFTLSVLMGGGSVVFPRTLTPQSILQSVEHHRATHVWLVPPTLAFVLAARALERTDLSTLREVVYAAAPMLPDLLRAALQHLGCGFRQIYGMTEALLVATQVPSEYEAYSTAMPAHLPAGRPVPGMLVTVHADDGRLLPAGQTGRIGLTGRAVIDRYLPEADGTPSVPLERDHEGRYLTSDVGHVDENGFVYLSGRVSEMISRGGQKIRPYDVETVLLEHERVRDAVVVAAPDPTWGESPHAFIVPGDAEPSVDDLIRHCARTLASYQLPTGFTFVTQIPRSPTGKVVRHELGQIHEHTR